MTVYANRRLAIFNHMSPQSIAIIPGNPELHRNGDAMYPFRQNSDFYYVTGFNEPDACAVLIKTQKGNQYILFNRPNNPAQERWDGARSGQLGAVEIFGANQSFAIDSLSEKLPELIQGSQTLYFAFGRNAIWDEKVLKILDMLRSKVRSGIQVPEIMVNCETILHDMRLIKGVDEIELMRTAAQISTKAHLALMKMTKPGVFEYELEAKFVDHCMKHDARYPAYTPIVAGGSNSCVLHYIKNDMRVNDGDILLVDAGCEYQYYASDITRTYPVNGKFTPEQKAIYELVLEAQLAGIAAVKPGVPWPDLQAKIIRILTEGLVELKILKGKVDELIEKKAYFQFYMHNSGHWLGLDVHDVGLYKVGDTWRELAENMVLTVEPGLYISPNSEGVDPKWWGIGVRIEDDVRVAQQGADVLSEGLPKTVADIEHLMHHG